MNNSYQLVLRPNRYFVLPGSGPTLTEQMVLDSLAGVVIHELSEDEHGNRTLHVELPASSDAEALDALVFFAEQLGFKVLEATVKEWASQVIERALLGLLGGGAVGVASENGPVALVAALGGAVIGGLSGAEARKLVAEYDARRDQWARGRSIGGSHHPADFSRKSPELTPETPWASCLGQRGIGFEPRLDRRPSGRWMYARVDDECASDSLTD